MQYPTDTNSLLTGVGAVHDDQSKDATQQLPQPASLQDEMELTELATITDNIRRNIRVRDAMTVDQSCHQDRPLDATGAHRPWVKKPNDPRLPYGATPSMNSSGPHMTSVQSWLEAPLGRDPFNNIGEVVSPECGVTTVHQSERKKDKSITAATAGSGKSERPAVDRGGETSLGQKAQRS
ncbi:hypothetical protein CPLU01_13109 [Colletotrichum plurivorum]|uniref:Uncharacterized protein n=1 Tax=Colletotrichum plurivorum TaxID=2175906 RepID=A0A8H6N4F8_9PEZI|nr:hypothetical protein CPLU01_13109 [Colletotrichum plurivorum]